MKNKNPIKFYKKIIFILRGIILLSAVFFIFSFNTLIVYATHITPSNMVAWWPMWQDGVTARYNDESGFGTGIDLHSDFVANVTNVAGLPNNGIIIASVASGTPTHVRNNDVKIAPTLRISDSFRIEIWFKPAFDTQVNPLFTINDESSGNNATARGQRNFAIVQNGRNLQIFVRNSTDGTSGGQLIFNSVGVFDVSTAVVNHFSFTYNGPAATFSWEFASTGLGSGSNLPIPGPVGPDLLDNWTDGYSIRFGNYVDTTPASGQLWYGEIYNTVIYDDPSTPDEVFTYKSTDHDGDSDVSVVYGGSDCDDNDFYINSTYIETCDGLDNNCSDPNHADGINPAQIDEIWKDGGSDDLGNVCTAGFGSCALSGTYVCNALKTSTECNITNGKTPGTFCNDGLECTTSDACSGGGSSSCDGTAKAVGTECSDIDTNDCTYDTCNANKTCSNKASIPPDCVDTFSCTDNSCFPTSATTHTCSNPISATKCLIGGACYNSGETQLGNDCSSCNPSAPTVWTQSANGTVCALDGFGCTYNTCLSGACQGGGNPPGYNDGLACTDDACVDVPPPDNVNYTLTHTTQASKCLINVVGTPTCFNEGDDDPSNVCKECISLTSNSSYSNKTAGSSCADALFCNGAETCGGGVSAGVCLASSNPCPPPTGDGDSDCSEVCVEASDTCTGNDNFGAGCNDGQYCTQTDTCNATGSCVSTGNPCPGPDNDGDCSETCDETVNACTGNDTTGSACNDSNACTTTDQCNNTGSCQGSGGPVIDDGNDCTADACDPFGGVTHTNLTGTPCDDLTYCNGADTCSAGACTTHVGNPCPGPDGDANCKESCNEAADSCTLNDPNTSACNDGKSCTNTDQCSGGVCGGIANDALCNDTKECTNDVCNPASASSNATTGCVITIDVSNPCSDGSLCTSSDACKADATCQGTPVVCNNDGLSCTDRDCIPVTGACPATYTLQAGFCLIANQCVDQGAVRGTTAINKDYPCQECNTGIRTDDWSPRGNTVMCNDLDVCTQNDRCDGAGACKGAIIPIETNCFDGKNNDCAVDNLIDADDPDCVPKKPPVVKVNSPFNTRTGKVIFAFRNQVVQLDATKSYDPDGGSLTYAWTVTGAPDTLSNPNIVNPTFTVPGSDAVIALKITGTDDDTPQTSSSDIVTIVVSEDCRKKSR